MTRMALFLIVLATAGAAQTTQVRAQADLTVPGGASGADVFCLQAGDLTSGAFVGTFLKTESGGWEERKDEDTFKLEEKNRDPLRWNSWILIAKRRSSSISSPRRSRTSRPRREALGPTATSSSMRRIRQGQLIASPSPCKTRTTTSRPATPDRATSCNTYHCAEDELDIKPGTELTATSGPPCPGNPGFFLCPNKFNCAPAGGVCCPGAGTCNAGTFCDCSSRKSALSRAIRGSARDRQRQNRPLLALPARQILRQRQYVQLGVARPAPEEIQMKKLDGAMLALLLVAATALATSASAAPRPSGPASAVDRPVLLISDNCETDEEGVTHCYDPPPQQAPPQYESPSAQRRRSSWMRCSEPPNRRRPRSASATGRGPSRRTKDGVRKPPKRSAGRREAKAEKERRSREAIAEKKRKQKQAERDRKRREAKQADEAEQDRKQREAEAPTRRRRKTRPMPPPTKVRTTRPRLGPPPTCEGDACKGGTVETTTLDGKPVTVVIGPTDDFPPPSTIPDSICQLKIGNTTIYCDGYLPGLPPTRTSCRGRTEDGCYLRPVTVPKSDGESGEACMQFCINKRPPPVVTEDKPPKGPKKPPVVAKDPGKPAVPTGTATVYREPKHPGTPAVKTGTATVYVWPKPRPTPAVKTATATTRVWPKPALTPAVQTSTAATYVEPKAAP